MNHDLFRSRSADLFKGLAPMLLTVLLGNMPAGAVPGIPDSTVAGTLSRHPFSLAQATSAAEAALARGMRLASSGDYAAAVKAFSDAIQQDPRSWGAYFGRGLSLSALGKWGDAVVDLTRSIELNPQNAKALFHRGNAKVQTQDLPGAAEDYTRAKMIDSRFADAYFNRAVVVIKMSTNNKKLAIKDLETAAEIYRSEGNPQGLQRVQNVMQAIQSIGQ